VLQVNNSTAEWYSPQTFSVLHVSALLPPVLYFQSQFDCAAIATEKAEGMRERQHVTLINCNTSG
jgi:hypothetical protein